MNLFKYFKEEIVAALGRLAEAGKLPQGLDTSKVTAEPPREEAHGDVATNAAMVLSKAAGMKPRDIADALAEELRKHPAITAVEVAGPGFINLRLADSFWFERLAEVLTAGVAYGDGEAKGHRINVEYVSANPTGPMHVGHARGAVVGDALASLLAKAGFDVTREYYINDAGAQVDVLAKSLRGRYLVETGKITQADFDKMREDGEVQYGGDYVRDCALALIARDGDRWVEAEESAWMAPFRDFAIDHMMGMIREDLQALGVKHDVFTSERDLVRTGKVDAALKFLEERDEVYVGVLEPPKGKIPDDWEPRPQVLFRATRFGDDVDRPLKKSDGSFTYFASDIA
ncbi:MAG TPA: arginine--tRNA ligase, partial [Magnetospirillum sp.]|nr:arginine--tRNA ligase [Magnetospirillum sp.]